MIELQNLRAILQATITRSSQEIGQPFLKSRLLGVFLSALLYDYQRTVEVLTELGWA